MLVLGPAKVAYTGFGKRLISIRVSLVPVERSRRIKGRIGRFFSTLLVGFSFLFVVISRLNFVAFVNSGGAEFRIQDQLYFG
jgi:hypothetical protein